MDKNNDNKVNINIIHKKKTLKNNYDNENDIINDKDLDIEFEKKKIKIIESYLYRKYTFKKNTIHEFTIVNGKLIPINKKNI